MSTGPIGKPQKQFHFVTDEKGKIKWNFTTEVRENKFTPKGFRNCKSKLPVTILVVTTKESRLLEKYQNYAQMKKEMLARNGKLYKKNIIKFNELELVKTKKTVKWPSKLEEYRFFVSDHENDDDEERIKKPKKKLDEMTKLKNILNDQPAESTNDEDEDEDEEDDTDDEEDWNVGEEEED
ncbi:hypothetical protein niasHS_002968 [Heterodera schachtii]|uniref:Uncharacterized protein n=2 Tax=Heterodera TaxID=34509 RepID=A0ABD2K9B5_HETSC